jgi:hypothetical protein
MNSELRLPVTSALCLLMKLMQYSILSKYVHNFDMYTRCSSSPVSI